MLIYNTTYHLEEEVEENFIIWLKEVLIPEVEQQEALRNPRICKILTAQEDGQVSYSLQWEVENSTILHRWHIKHGTHAKDQIKKIFQEKVLGFDTLMKKV